MKWMLINIMLFFVLMFISCSAVYNKNEDEINKAVINKELEKGNFTNIQITGHQESKKAITVFVSMKNAAGNIKLDTLTFSLTGDGYINE